MIFKGNLFWVIQNIIVRQKNKAAATCDSLAFSIVCNYLLLCHLQTGRTVKPW